MDNLEEDTQETITTVTANTSTVTAADLDLTAVAGPITGGGQEENFDDSVIMLPPPHVDVVDLTVSPSQPSTSAGAGACGLLKPKIEEPSGSKDTSTAADNPSTSSSSSVSGLTGASSGVGGGGAHTASITTTTSNLLECPICLQTCIHPARLPCGHIFCFLCVKGVAYKNRRCAMCRREIPPEFLDHPQLVNGIEDICTTKATDDGYQWFYEGRNGWWQYDDRTSQDLEEAFKKGDRSCTILVAGYVYIVDFDAMIQQRQNEPARCRRVKRDLATIPKKGVAGLRIEGNTVTTDSNFAQQVYFQNRYLNDDLDIHDNVLMGAAHAMDANNPPGPRRLSYGLGGYVIELGNPSEFVSTAAATDAALRIASDIIGSTLAHADELTRSNTNASQNTASTSSSSYQQPLSLSSLATDTSLNPATGELNINDLALISQQQQQQLHDMPNANVAGSINAITTAVSSMGHTQQPQPQQQQPTNSSLPRERGSRELLGAAEDLLGATQRVIATADQPTIDLFEQTLNDFHALTLRNIVDSSDDDDGLQHHHHHHHHHHPAHAQQQQLQAIAPAPPPHAAQVGQSQTQPPPNGQRSSNGHHDNLP